MRYIELANANLGLELARDVIDEYGRILVTQGTNLTEKLVARLKNFGITYITVDDKWSDGISLDFPIPETMIAESYTAVENHDIDGMFECATKIVETLVNSDLLEQGYQTLKQYDENTCQHSINVAIKAVTFGIGIGLRTEQLNNIAVGSLLHDIGKERVPIEIITKNGKLEPEEREEVEKHCKHGYDILSQDILVPASVKAIVYQHHENWDGSGYPRKLKEYQVYELAAIVHICDVFDALISKRSYKNSFSYQESIQFMQDNSGKMFSPYYLKKFFQYVPIYTVGSTVRLSNGEYALIVKNIKGDMLNPLIRLESGEEIQLSNNNDLKIVS